ncbi:MAG: HdeD family acid-resistance protein [Kutzneria sp.]|nr:HdeD family acid-resistance protein [Kutzneria sp.]MBV9844690.1 HdeD family acid-resistance protein [Kutzneria sp.]
MSSLSPTPASSVVIDPRRAWPLLLTRGAVAVVFGLIALLWPAVTVLALALIFGVYSLIDGIGGVIHAARSGDRGHRWFSLIGGALGIAAGVVALVWPAITVLVLATLVGAWAVVTGVAEIAAAIRLRHQIRGEVFLIIAGAVSAVAGILILFQPIAGAFGIAIVVGSYAIVYGLVLAVLAIRLRSLAKATTSH